MKRIGLTKNAIRFAVYAVLSVMLSVLAFRSILFLPLFLSYFFSLYQSVTNQERITSIVLLSLLTPFIAAHPYMFIILCIVIIGLVFMIRYTSRIRLNNT